MRVSGTHSWPSRPPWKTSRACAPITSSIRTKWRLSRSPPARTNPRPRSASRQRRTRTTLPADRVANNPQTVQNARLWDPQLALPSTLETLQSLRTYYQFYPNEVAVDRSQLGSQYLQLLLAELVPVNRNFVRIELVIGAQ